MHAKFTATFFILLKIFICGALEQPILDENIRITIMDTDAEGKTVFRRLTRSATENPDIVYANENPAAAVRSNENEQITGNGQPMSFSETGYTIRGKKPDEYKDYIDSGRKIKPAKKCRSDVRVKAVVETLVISDQEWSALFNYDYDKIVNYWTAFFWDVNMRYKTLPSDDISFQINDIIVIANKSAQPFIENAREGPNGAAGFYVLLDLFKSWVYEKREKLPVHDVAALAINALIKEDGIGGIGVLEGACGFNHAKKQSLGIVTFRDSGQFGGVFTATHEMGHVLAANHDFEDSTCEVENQSGFIMGGTGRKTAELEFFFSNCSDRSISRFVRSESTSCLRTLSNNNPKIDPSFDNAKVPSMDEQAKMWAKYLGYKSHRVEDHKDGPCKQKIIWDNNPPYYGFYFTPVDNSDCSNGGVAGKCFRGVCRQPAQLFKNVGSGLCIQASNPFDYAAPFLMVKCPSSRGTALDKIFIKEAKSGSALLSPFVKFKEVGERCAYVTEKEESTIWTDRCNMDNKWFAWDFQDIGNNQFLLKHRVTGRCAKPQSNDIGSSIGTYKECDSKDKNMKWEKF